MELRNSSLLLSSECLAKKNIDRRTLIQHQHADLFSWLFLGVEFLFLFFGFSGVTRQLPGTWRQHEHLRLCHPFFSTSL